MDLGPKGVLNQVWIGSTNFMTYNNPALPHTFVVSGTFFILLRIVAVISLYISVLTSIKTDV